MFNQSILFMQLFTKRKRATGGSARHPETLVISRTIISLGGKLIQRLNLPSNAHIGVGINDSGRLCLFYTREAHPDLFKLSAEKGKESDPEATRRINLSKDSQEALKELRGEYTISEPTLRSGIFQCIMYRKGVTHGQSEE